MKNGIHFFPDTFRGSEVGRHRTRIFPGIRRDAASLGLVHRVGCRDNLRLTEMRTGLNDMPPRRSMKKVEKTSKVDHVSQKTPFLLELMPFI